MYSKHFIINYSILISVQFRVGILDVFLSVIAKALTVQVKVKSKEGKGLTSVTLATAIHPRQSVVGKRWWLRGCISRKLAEDIIQLIKDMSAVSITNVVMCYLKLQRGTDSKVNVVYPKSTVHKKLKIDFFSSRQKCWI